VKQSLAGSVEMLVIEAAVPFVGRRFFYWFDWSLAIRAKESQKGEKEIEAESSNNKTDGR